MGSLFGSHNARYNSLFAIALFALTVVIVSVICELFLFNFRHFESLTFNDQCNAKISFTTKNYEELESDGKIEMIAPILKEDADNTSIFVSNEFQEEIDNISFAECRFIDKDIHSNTVDANLVPIKVFIRDEGNSLFYQLPIYEVNSIYEPNAYLRIHAYGKVKQFIFVVQNNNISSLGDFFVEFNKVVPIEVSKYRMLFMTILMFIVVGLYPKTRLMVCSISQKKVIKFAILVSVVLLEIFILYWIANHVYAIDWKSVDGSSSSHNIYGKLTEALVDGHFYLDYDVSDIQLNAQNPYDRFSLLGTGYFDNAYFEGKYYCYFGILPVILFFLPYYFITHSILPIWIAVSISFVLISISLMFFVVQIKKRYFKYLSLRNTIILDLLVFFGSGCVFIGLEPYFYSMIILLGISMTAFGCGFWLMASNTNKNYLYFIGSIFMSLVCWARPTLMLGSLLVFPFAIMPLYRRYVSKDNNLFKVIRIIFINMIPYIIVGGFQMYYNYKRFGSIIDFGANYNITTNDMTHRGFVIDRFFPGIFEYLFQPPRLVPEFPFLQGYNFSMENSGYIGTTIMEKSYGGYLWLCPASLFSFAFFIKRFKGRLQSCELLKEVHLSSIICLAIGLFLVLSDIQIAGILFRYFQDFGFFFSLAGLLPLGILLEDNRSGFLAKSAYATTLYTILIWAFVVMSFMFVFIYE